MKKVFYLTGKSSSGKDSIYKQLITDKGLQLQPVLPCTTRPKRQGETEGSEYHFVDEETYQRAERNGDVIECRTYDTVHGPWRYFTARSAFEDDREYYLGIGTLESYVKIRDRFGEAYMVPIYIEVEDGERLRRAMEREKASGKPDYAEMCRRFLADDEDFSDEKLKEAGIGPEYIFENDDLEDCIDRIRGTIIGYQGK